MFDPSKTPRPRARAVRLVAIVATAAVVTFGPLPQIAGAVPLTKTLSAAPTPTISGARIVGTTLTAKPGLWKPAPVVLAYRWRADGTAIAGATRATFRLTTAQAGKRITVTVTGTKSGYAKVARTSAPTATILRPLTSTPVPSISGSPTVGGTLRASSAPWAPAPVALAHQWRVAGVAVKGATGTTYTIRAADVGKVVTVSVTGTRAGYAPVTRTSAGTPSIGRRLTATPVPTVTGTPTPGSTLIAHVGSWGPSPVTLTYRWRSNGVAIAGATHASFVVPSNAAGTTVTVAVTGTKPGYTGVTRTSGPVVVTAVGFTTAPVPTVTGSSVVGSVLTASSGTWVPTPTALRYQWSADGVAIPGATASTYTPVVADAGAVLTVTTTATRTGLPATSRTSTGTARVRSTEASQHRSGTITASETWSPTVASEYDIVGDLTIAAGAVVTVRPGTVVAVAGGRTLEVDGELDVQGTAARPASFDGSTASTWSGIRVAAGGVLVAQHAVVAHADTAIGGSTTGRVEVADSTVSGVGFGNGRVSISGSRVDGGASIDHDTSDTSAITFAGNTVTGEPVSIHAATTSTAAGPVIVQNNTVTGVTNAWERGNANYPIVVDVGRLRPSNLTGNVLSGNDSNVIGVAGHLVEDWTVPAGVHYVVATSHGLTVDPGATMTLAPGAVLKVEKEDFGGAWAPISTPIVVDGRLNVTGSAALPAVITTIVDDSVGGDTNADGDRTSPAPPPPIDAGYSIIDWVGIQVEQGGAFTASYARVLHAQQALAASNATGISITDSDFAGIGTTGSPVSVLRTNSSQGIDVERGTADRFAMTVADDTVTGGQLVVISSAGAAATPLVVQRNRVTNVRGGSRRGNALYPILVDDARLQPSNLTGNTVSGNDSNVFGIGGHLVENWTMPSGMQYVVATSRGLTVDAGVTLTLPAGAVIKVEKQDFGGPIAPNSTPITIDGALIAQGTAAKPIVLTSIVDDSVGGDTNADGDATAPAPPSTSGGAILDWVGVVVDDGGTMTASYLTVSDAQYGVDAVASQLPTSLLLDAVTLSHDGTCLNAGDSVVGHLHGVVRDCPGGVAADAPFDATDVDWGDPDGPPPTGDGVDATGTANIVPWVGYPTPPTMTAQPASTPITSCSAYDTTVIVARGSGETPVGPWSVSTDPSNYDHFSYADVRSQHEEFRGLGNMSIKLVTGQTVNSDFSVTNSTPGLVGHLDEDPTTSSARTRIIPLNYPADSTDKLPHVDTKAAGGVRIPGTDKYLHVDLGDFLDYMGSVQVGVSSLEQQILDVARICPNQRIVLVGYSQGAMAVRFALGEMAQSGGTSAAAIGGGRIAAVALIGDPLKDPWAGQTAAYFGTDSDSPHNGLFPILWKSAGWMKTLSADLLGDAVDDAYPTDIASVTASECDTYDAMCAPVDRFDWDVHAGYTASSLDPIAKWTAAVIENSISAQHSG